VRVFIVTKPANAATTINIIDPLKIEVEQLQRVLAMNFKVGNTYPGQSQVEQIIAIISELERDIRN
jgi:hypothetical protein